MAARLAAVAQRARPSISPRARQTQTSGCGPGWRNAPSTRPPIHSVLRTRRDCPRTSPLSAPSPPPPPPTSSMWTTALAMAALLTGTTATHRPPTECADRSMTLWMRNSAGKTPCELAQDVLQVCDPSFQIGFLSSNYTCENSPGSPLAPCCCGSPTFALMSACWSCQYNITFDLVTTTFTAFEKDCPTLPNPITTYDATVRERINALSLPAWSQIEPLAGKWNMTSAWENSTPGTASAMPMPTGNPYQVTTTGISKGALAAATVGAILGSMILFMVVGCFFYRWWTKQPGHQHDDDEKGYVPQVVGEPRSHLRARLSGRRGSRGRVDLDEDASDPPRWLGVPGYLHPTPFHSQSSGSGSPPTQNHPRVHPEPGAVTPFRTDSQQPQSEKQTRRESLRVTNEHIPDADIHHNVPRPMPALLARAQSLSATPPHVSPPHSPVIASGSIPLLAGHGRSHSQSLSTDGTLSSVAGRYQEDDAGVSLVIEDGSRGESPSAGSIGGSGGGIRSVPPAYVDYRQGYSQADKAPRFESAGSVEGGGTSESATYIGSGSSENPTRAGSLKAVSTAGLGAKTGVEKEEGTPTTMTATETVLAPPETRVDSPTASTIGLPAASTTDLPAPTAGPSTAATVANDETRDRIASGDSEGAETIKPDIAHPVSAMPLERSSTTDLANLTAANTVANRTGSVTSTNQIGSATPATVIGLTPVTTGGSGGQPVRPGTSASVRTPSRGSRGSRGSSGRPAAGARGQLLSGGNGGSGGLLAPSGHSSGGRASSLGQAEPESLPESTTGHRSESSWTWSRALGVFGIGFPGSSGSPVLPPPSKD